MPYLTIVCVCPPQTSMIVHGRVTVRAMAAASLPAASPSRYSSRYFIMAGAPPARRAASSLPGTRRPAGLGLVDARQGEADVDQDVVAGPDLGHVLQADPLAERRRNRPCP